MEKIENCYVNFVNSLIEIGDTILLFALPIWAGIVYPIDDSIIGRIITTIILFIIFTIPFLPFTHLFKMTWHVIGFILLLPLNIKKTINNEQK
jgi:hypothetical protein